MNYYSKRDNSDYVRLILALVFLAVSVLIMTAAVVLIISRNQPSGKSRVVSSSEMTVSRTDSSPGHSAGSGTTGNKADWPEKTVPTTATNLPAPENSDFVRVRDYIPDIEVEIIYATDRNFTGQVIYGFDDAWLRYGTVKKLAKAQEKLKTKGVRLKIWDAFRPTSAQFRLWEICPDPRYVSDPNKGFSSHSRGNTVDVTLVGKDSAELTMPTGFDDFSALADRDYSDVRDKEAVSNARLLENTMKQCGFKPYSGEWWHFSDSVKYDVAKEFNPASQH